MKVVITTCSANHLAQAKGLGDSVMQFNPDYKFVVGLVDRIDGRIDTSGFPYEIIEAHELDIPSFTEMTMKYDVLELNCALKIFFAEHVILKYQLDRIIFLDSDILVFHSLRFLEESLEQTSVLLTPHITVPYPADGLRPREREMLKNGIYNGGFFAFRTDENGVAFLQWMKHKMATECLVEPKEGLFVDQAWLNLVPLYFDVNIIGHPGCNAAYWNLHERKTSKKENRFYVNNEPLIFFHYSGYSADNPELISRHQDRVSFEGNDALKEVFEIYRRSLLDNDHKKYLSLTYAYKHKGFLQKLGLKK